MQLTPYLNFNGQCEEAFRFYEKVLGGRIVSIMPHAGTPAENSVPAEWRSKVMHAVLQLDDRLLMGSDVPPQYATTPAGFALSLHFEDKAQGERIFNALAEGGKINMPFQETFWANGFGMLVDRFQVPWMVNCQKQQ